MQFSTTDLTDETSWFTLLLTSQSLNFLWFRTRSKLLLFGLNFCKFNDITDSWSAPRKTIWFTNFNLSVKIFQCSNQFFKYVITNFANLTHSIRGLRPKEPTSSNSHSNPLTHYQDIIIFILVLRIFVVSIILKVMNRSKAKSDQFDFSKTASVEPKTIEIWSLVIKISLDEKCITHTYVKDFELRSGYVMLQPNLGQNMYMHTYIHTITHRRPSENEWRCFSVLQNVAT